MRVPTVRIKHPTKGTMVVNETDWALGSIPGVNLGSDWTRIGERSGEGDDAVEAAKEQRRIVEAQSLLAGDIEKRAKIDNIRKKTASKAPMVEK